MFYARMGIHQITIWFDLIYGQHISSVIWFDLIWRAEWILIEAHLKEKCSWFWNKARPLLALIFYLISCRFASDSCQALDFYGFEVPFERFAMASLLRYCIYARDSFQWCKCAHLLLMAEDLFYGEPGIPFEKNLVYLQIRYFKRVMEPFRTKSTSLTLYIACFWTTMIQIFFIIQQWNLNVLATSTLGRFVFCMILIWTRHPLFAASMCTFFSCMTDIDGSRSTRRQLGSEQVRGPKLVQTWSQCTFLMSLNVFALSFPVNINRVATCCMQIRPEK